MGHPQRTSKQRGVSLSQKEQTKLHVQTHGLTAQGRSYLIVTVHFPKYRKIRSERSINFKLQHR